MTVLDATAVEPVLGSGPSRYQTRSKIVTLMYYGHRYGEIRGLA